MRKALIITFYQATNYGAFLQAFATQTFLNVHGFEANILNWKVGGGTVHKTVTKLYHLLKPAKAVSEAEGIYRAAVKKAVVSEQKKRLRMSDGSNHVSLTVLGSDEIWNVRNIGSSHDAFFFSPNPNSDRTIAYAPCVGKTKLHELRMLPYAVRGLRKLDAVSARDDRTEEILRQIGRDDCVRVLDPTFLIDFTPFLPEVPYKQPYCLIYSYSLTEAEVAEILSFCKKENLKTIATGAHYAWADENPAPAPFEWVALIRNAAFVVTSTFHGTALAIECRKNFAVYHNTPKVLSMLSEVGLGEQTVNGERTLEKIYQTGVDYEAVDGVLQPMIDKSQAYILGNLPPDTEDEK